MKILITGASSGIGKDMSRELCEKGNELILVARDEKKLNSVKQELINLGGNVETISIDLSNIDNCKEIHKRVRDVDILINNARIWGLW